MSKDKVLQQAVRTAVMRAAKALKEKDNAFSRDLDEQFTVNRTSVHPRQLSIDNDLFPTFPYEMVVKS